MVLLQTGCRRVARVLGIHLDSIKLSITHHIVQRRAVEVKIA